MNVFNRGVALLALIATRCNQGRQINGQFPLLVKTGAPLVLKVKVIFNGKSSAKHAQLIYIYNFSNLKISLQTSTTQVNN